ncbi:hypothetical protein SRHO_G00235870 [Serrasalmus rhombeus]
MAPKGYRELNRRRWQIYLPTLSNISDVCVQSAEVFSAGPWFHCPILDFVITGSCDCRSWKNGRGGLPPPGPTKH